MIRFSALGVLAAIAIWAGGTKGQQPVHHIDYPAEFSADQILNGNLPGRPPSPPPLDVRYDDTGFAKGRLFHVPPVGVHPRVLFGPEDVPGIRERLAHTTSGKQMLAFTRKQIASGIDKPGTLENQLYRLLLGGDLKQFGLLYKPQEMPYVAGNSPATAGIAPATKWHHRDSFGMALEMKAFLCLLDDNRREGAELGKVIAAYASYYKPRIQSAAAGPFGDNWWRSMRAAVEGWPFLPLAYDLDFNFMTAAEQKTTREVLALDTAGRYTLGMELPPHWRVWNFLGMSLYEAIFSLAIEGEPGYDPRVAARCFELARDYLSYGINPSGMAHESVGYHSAGIFHTSAVMIALANRGQNLFTHSHYRAQFDNWFLETLQPYGGEWFSDGDLGNFPAGTEPVMIAKYFYPNDAKLDFVYQNTPEARENNWGKDLYVLEAMLVANDPGHDANGHLLDYHTGADFHLPTTYADEHRGVVITRNDWARDTLYFNFECHPDTVFASHDHADRGRFVLTALGRNWAWQDSRPHETSQSNSVLIDDEGQGFFPTYARYLGMADRPQATFAACDAKYNYDWKWRKEAGMWPDDDPRFKSSFYATQRKNSPKLDPEETEYDPSPQIAAFYKDYLAGYPRFWDEDSWVVRQPNNPVEYAFRSGGIVRGEHPYALIVDDLKKDSASHVYKWLMQLEEDLSIASQSRHDGVHDIVLKEKSGDRRLLVRILEGATPSGDAIAEHYPTEYTLQGMPTARSTMYRLTVPFATSTFRGKVLLYPFHAGETLPALDWNPAAQRATMGQDELVFHVDTDQHTRVTVMRKGQELVMTP